MTALSFRQSPTSPGLSSRGVPAGNATTLGRRNRHQCSMLAHGSLTGLVTTCDGRTFRQHPESHLSAPPAGLGAPHGPACFIISAAVIAVGFGRGRFPSRGFPL